LSHVLHYGCDRGSSGLSERSGCSCRMGEQRRQGHGNDEGSNDTQNQREGVHAKAGPHRILGLKFVDLPHCAAPFRAPDARTAG
jgi:hypothetical protein